jgi:hypothetical protein
MDHERRRFRRGIGVALVTLCLVLGILVAFGQTLSMCSATFALDPTGDSTRPGGQTKFFIHGITHTSCDWLANPALDQGPPGVTVTFEPAGGWVLPAHKIASGSATVSVGKGVAPGTYSLRIKLNLTRSDGETSEAAPPQYLNDALEVRRGK